ncbi:hypothetical protein Tco_0105672 [Tanacetum coccineum]
MTTLKFAEAHNMIAFLEKPTELKGFKQVIDFLNASCIHYALIVNPTVYVSHITQFWTRAQVKKVNGVTELQALVDGKPIVVSEAFIRRLLKFNDEGSMDCLPNATIFEEIRRMGQYKVPCHSKKIFASMKRKNADFSGTVTPLFPIMVMQPPLSPPPATTTSPTPPPVSTKRTPLPPTIPPTIETTPPTTTTTPISSPQASPIRTTSTQPSTQPSKQRVKKSKDTQVTQPSVPIMVDVSVPNESNDPPGGEDRLKLTELMDPYTTLQAKVLDLEKTKASQQRKIESLDRRVKKLEKDKKKRTHKLKRLYKVGLSARVISSDDEEPDLEVQEDEFKYGRSIADIDEDAEVILVQGRRDEGHEEMFDAELDLAGEEIVVEEVRNEEVMVEKVVEKSAKNIIEEEVALNEDEITLAQTLQKLKNTPKAKGVAPKAKSISIREPSESHRAKIPKKNPDKGKGKMVEPEKPLKRKQQILLDEEEARRLQSIFDEEARLAKEEANKEAQLVEDWDNVKAKVDTDYELASKLQAEEQQELSIEEKSKLFVDLIEKRKRHFAAKRAEEKRNKPPTKAQKRKTMSTYLKNIDGWKLDQLKGKSYNEVEKLFDQAMARINNFVGMDIAEEAKKLGGTSKRASNEPESKSRKKPKMDDEEIAKLQALIEITPAKEEVPINDIPLAMKPPAIVDYGIHKEGRVGFYKITREDGLDTIFRVFSVLLYSFDREDLETLWKLVKARHGDTRPEEGFERMLWGDLKTMFEPNVQDLIWRELRHGTVLIWKLFSSCGVHLVRFSNIQVYMLVERRYPLTKPTLTDMLNKKL